MDPPLEKSSPRGPRTDSAGAATDGGPLIPIVSSSPSARPEIPVFRPRTTSTHSLLAASGPFDLRRKAHVETNTTPPDRASISMPQSYSQPRAEKRLSLMASQRYQNFVIEETQNSTKGQPVDPRQIHVSPSQRHMSTTAMDTTAVTAAASSSSTSYGLPLLSASAQSPTVQTSLDSNSSSQPSGSGPTSSEASSAQGVPAGKTLKPEPAFIQGGGVLRNTAPRSNPSRSISAQRRVSTPSQRSIDIHELDPKKAIGTIGVCALDVKARSRPSRQILTRLQGDGDFEVVVFGDKAILDEDVRHWPICDFLIAFFSDGFPLDKAIEYVKLRKPFVVNDLAMQKVLWDRRLCLRILDSMKVATPSRIEVNRDGGPTLESAELARHVRKFSGVTLPGPEDGTGGGTPITKKVELVDDGDTLLVDGVPFKKPFVEKPISGEDHNVIIYFPKSHQGGGARRLFRKIGNKSSEWDPTLIVPRSITEPDQSYIYEQFLNTENSEDVKAYTVGPDYCHAETRKSPVVDGLVRRNTHGKELRYVTTLSDQERDMASRVSRGFGQRICGFDLLRSNGQSFVIDVNGWSFVKDNEHYYNTCATILRSIFSAEKSRLDNESTDESLSEAPTPGISRSSTAGMTAHHPHRTVLKTILKTPSISKLSAHLNHSRHHLPLVSSPKTGSTTTTSLSSPPSMDKPDGIQLPLAPKSVPVSVPEPVAEIVPQDALSAGAAIDNNASDAVRESVAEPVEPAPALPLSKHSWKLKGVVTVIRHADRTPKQKIKFTAHSQVFVDLLKGHHEEVLLKGEAALSSVETAVKIAQQQGIEDQEKLRNLRNALAKKRSQPATKVQIKPMFKKRPKAVEAADGEPAARPRADQLPASIPERTELQHIDSPGTPSGNEALMPITTRSDSTSGTTFSRYAASDNDMVVEKLQLVMKWGGEPTHSARYQSQDLGSNMRDDYKLLNRRVLDDVRIFTSSEKRVRTSAQIWAGAFLGRDDIPEDYIQVRKDLLDDSNAAKDLQDKVKKKLKHLLRQGNSVPEEFAWPNDVPEPYIVMHMVVDLLRFHRRVMRHNFKKLSGGAAASLIALTGSPDGKDPKDAREAINVSAIQARWCTGEDPELFRERWEKLFAEFCDTEKADPSKISELYDTMKYDALHNKQFLEWVFTPSQSVLDEIAKEDAGLSTDIASSPSDAGNEETVPGANRANSTTSSIVNVDKQSFAQKIGLRRRSVLPEPLVTPPSLVSNEKDGNYFKLYSGSGEGRLKQDRRLGRLRELYRYSKILFDFIGPQEYGISNDEKLEIGLLTSLPLLREIVQDLEELQASGDAKFFCYFTKESHIYTLLNCIMEGGIPTKIKRSAIPELDYLSQICFELYEATDEDTQESFYSIRISISPGCHTVDPLDVSLDSKHAIGTAQRRSLTSHQDWKEVISTLKAKFNTVQLPKSFLAVNVSDKHEMDARDIQQGARNGWTYDQQEEDGQVQITTTTGLHERGRSPLRPADYELAPEETAPETVVE
ncbi:hypothetical protein DV738_g2031, partial [Chaetothyriales sp. CBS 135597]